MATKITDMTAASAAYLNDLLEKTQDPSGTPITRSVTLQLVRDLFEANTSHAARHTDGSDDIQNATSGQKGLMTAAAFQDVGTNNTHRLTIGNPHGTNHSDLGSVTSDQHHAQLHAASHADGAGDELTLQDLGSGALAIDQMLLSDGAGGWTTADKSTIGATTFLGLSDTPSSYQSNSLIITNAGGTALENSAGKLTFNGNILQNFNSSGYAENRIKGTSGGIVEVQDNLSNSAALKILQGSNDIYLTTATSYLSTFWFNNWICREKAAPAVSGSGEGKIYFDSTSKTYQVSENAGAFRKLANVIGTDVQAYDATLASLAGLGTAADRYAYTTGVDTWAEGTITAAGRAILDDADAATQRTTLGLGTAATSAATDFVATVGGDTMAPKLTISDDAATPPLNITERSAAPSSPASGDIYLDDGTNTGSGNPGWRRYTGAAWEDIAAAAGGAGTVTSVDVSGGTTGLTTSGGPVTTSGTITLAGTLAIANGGTNATSEANARTNLGLAIGTDVQAYDATLASLAGLGTAADRYAYTTGVDTWAEGTITAFARTILDDADAATVRATIGAGAGDVVGPASAVDDTICTFDGTTGKLIQDSGAKVEAAPTGGSGFVVVEYASAPTSPSAGFLWVQAKNATTKTLNYWDGSNTYSVDMSQ